jgi:hypothetical protein
MKKSIVAVFVSVFMVSSAAAEGIPCWIRCHCPPKTVSAASLPSVLRPSANPPLGWFVRASGIVTTYLGKLLGIQGWRDYHLRGRVKGSVVQAAGSTDFLYTIDLQIEEMHLGDTLVSLDANPRFIRVEVFPFARIGVPLPVKAKDEVCVSGKLMWDADGFLEIHPKKRRDFLEGRCK